MKAQRNAISVYKSENETIFVTKCHPFLRDLLTVSPPSKGFHLAFHANKKEEVHSFYEQALKHGGRDNGAPGQRPDYGTDYYAAFVIDPDGYELEIKLFV